MPATRSSRAIVLRTRPYGDVDAIVTLLSRDFGKFAGIAKGAKNSRRRFGNCLGPFTRVRVFFRNRAGANLAFLERCELLHPGSGLSAPTRLAYGSYVVELVDALTRELDPVPEIHDLLDAALAQIESTGATASLLRTFELRLLRDLGLGPSMLACARCQRRFDGEVSGFADTHHGVIVCERCEPGRVAEDRVGAATLAALSGLDELPLDRCAEVRLPPEVARQAAGLLGQLLGVHLTRPLRSIDLIAVLQSSEG